MLMLHGPARLYLIADPFDEEIPPLPVLVAVNEAAEPECCNTPARPDHKPEI